LWDGTGILTEQKDDANFECRLGHQANATVVTVIGALDLVTQATFTETVQESFERDTPSVVIDLSGVTFLASPGLAVLVEAQEIAMRTNKNLHVAVGNETVRRSVELTGLAQILSLVPDVQAALGE
jgi:anti-sigma B factor antagonist